MLMNERKGGRRRHGVSTFAFLVVVAVALTSMVAVAQGEMGKFRIVKETTPERGQDFEFVTDIAKMTWEGIPTDYAGHFDDPRGMAEGGPAYWLLYVVDAGHHRIQAWFEQSPYDMYPGFIWGSYGTGNGQFVDPVDIAVDPNWDVYVTDAGQARVQVFDWQGKFLRALGSRGNGHGQFREPSGIAIDRLGRAYVGDRVNDRVQVFSPDGKFIFGFGSSGTGAGQFGNPIGIALDAFDNSYVIDYELHRLQKFDETGQYVTGWGGKGTRNGQFVKPFGVVVDELGFVYVSDSTGRIQVFDDEGGYVDQLDASEWPQGAPELTDITMNWAQLFTADIANNDIHGFSRQHRYYELSDDDHVDLWIPGTHTITELKTAEGWELQSIACTGGNPEPYYRGVKFTVGPDDDITCTAHNNGPSSRLSFFNDAPTDTSRPLDYMVDPNVLTFVRQWGVAGEGVGQFKGATGIAIGPENALYILDTDRVQVFNTDGDLLDTWGHPGGGDGELHEANGIAIGKDRRIYIADSGNHRLQRFELDGSFQDKWGETGESEGEFLAPQGVAVDRSGHIYVVDTGNHRIQKFDADGNFVMTWGWGVRDGEAELQVCTSACQSGIPGDGDGQLGFPRNITVDSQGRVYVSDNYRNYLQAFDSNGAFVGRIDPGLNIDLWEADLAVDRADNLYAMGPWLAKFDSDGNLLGHTGYRGSLGETIGNRRGLAVDDDGTIFGAVIPWIPDESKPIQVYSQEIWRLAHGQSRSFELAAGDYDISEIVPDGWVLAGISCTGGAPVIKGSRVRVSLSEGDDVSCTFYNRQTGNEIFVPVVGMP